MTNNFDKAEFASLLKKAIGTRKQAEFAEEAGISKEHLSRFINQRLDAAPSAETLNRIAQQTTAVSISDFYAAAGYIMDEFSEDNISSKEARAIKLINATLVSSLAKFKTAWTIDYNFKGKGRHLSICFENAPLHHWHFHYMEHKIDSSIQQHLQKSYLDLIFKDLEPQDKYSFVTSSPNEYEAYKQKPPKNLQLNISVILVKNDTLSIAEETLLQSNHVLSKEELSEFAF